MSVDSLRQSRSALNNRMFRLCLVLLLCGLAGCSTTGGTRSWAPIPSYDEYAVTFLSRVERESGGAAQLNPSALKRVLIGFIGEVHSAAVEKRKLEWDNNAVTTYGAMAAVLGALADKTGLLNTGAGVAGFGLVNNSRYQFAQQSAIYMNEARKLTCVSSKVLPVPESVFEDAKQTDDPVAASAAQDAVKTIALTIDSIRIEAVNSLMAIAPSTPSREDILGMFNMYRAASGSAAPSADPHIARKRAAGEQITNLLAETGLCAKT